MSEQLLQHVEAIETLNEQKKDISDEISDRYKLAKMDGFDTKILKTVIKRRAIARAELEEMDAVLQTYEHALAELD